MFGLLLRSVQSYLRATFGAAALGRVLRAAGQSPDGFEPMLPYDQDVLERIIAACAEELGRPAEMILEDVGTFLVADAGHQPLRRLLRFGGATFLEFLQSLEELPDRARLALPDLELPQITIVETGPGMYRLQCGCSLPALFPMALGALRAMADDYGALVVIDPVVECHATEVKGALSVHLLETAHGAGRRFELAKADLHDGW